MHHTHDETKARRAYSQPVLECEAEFRRWVKGLRSLQPLAGDLQPPEREHKSSAAEVSTIALAK